MGNRSPGGRPLSGKPLSPPRASKTQDWPLPEDAIEAKVGDWTQWYGGKVVALNSDYTFQVAFDDGEVVPNVRFEEIRRPRPAHSILRTSTVPASPSRPVSVLRHATSAPMRTSSMPVYAGGARVTCKIPGWTQWFPGTVAQYNPTSGTYIVNFDDGDVVSTVRPHEMRPELLPQDVPTFCKPGASVECRCEGWHKYYPGVIKTVNLETMQAAVMFEDGEFRDDVLVTQIRMARTPSKTAVQFVEDGLPTAASKYKVGDRVMANPGNEWSKAYVGKVERVLNDMVSYAVLFDDGDRVAGVAEADMSLVSSTSALKGADSGPRGEAEVPFKVGSVVECRVGAWRTYYPGRVEACSAEDDTFRVLFVDGQVVERVLRAEMRHSRLAPSAEQGEAEAGARTPRAPAAAVPRPAPSHAAVAYALQDRVLAQLAHWKQAYGGRITRVNPNGTYMIQFDDGEIYSAVPTSCILGRA